jgi:hypothetical protein
MVILAGVMVIPELAYAHGMEGQEIGPPILTSGLLGFVCYWLVMLWPAAKKRDDPVTRSGNRYPSATATQRGRPQRYAMRVKQTPRLRKIERSGQATTTAQHPKRKAIDE